MATPAAAHVPTPRTAPRQRPSKKERHQLRQHRDALALAQQHSEHDGPRPDLEQQDAERAQRALQWLPLADTSASFLSVPPVVFSSDNEYCFVTSGSAVKIYSVRTTQLMSTLSIRPFSQASPLSPSSPSSTPASTLQRARVTAVLVNPSNPRQLIVGSTDAKVRIWDYLEGRLLRTLDMGTSVLHAVANAALPDQLYVALAPVEPAKPTAGASKAQRKKTDAREQFAGVYLVSLRPAKSDGNGNLAQTLDASTPRPPARRVRLAVPRAVRTLALSPDGSILASLTPQAVHLCRTAQFSRGFSQTVAAEDGEDLTTLAFHPTENYFATGNTKGQIRLWYDALGSPALGADGTSEGDQGDDTARAPSTALLHWHAHAVSSLAFTPNGAYLLSGGQEAVLVLWQLHTGHQEYVPRLGAPILALTVLDSAETGEQQVAARLRDGSIVFVGSQKLKAVKTITGLKAEFISSSEAPSASTAAAPPLAVDPSTSTLVLPAGHPSSLQFYSVQDDAQLLEVEIAPSNRVSNADLDKPLEPTRVERVAFSQPERNGGSYWMATLDSWHQGHFAPVRQLKFWRKKADGTTFALSTRINSPHDAVITSFAFSPSPVSPLLLTTSADGRIKVWAYASADASWRCRLSISHRSVARAAPVASAWSHDGSLFAIAHLRAVTLWTVAGQGELVHSFAATSIGRPKNVAFVDQEGTKVIATGTGGALCWDLLTLEETFSSTVDFAAVASERGTDRLAATEDSPVAADSSLLYILRPFSPSSTSVSSAGPSRPRTRPLPATVRQAVWLTSAAATSDADDAVSLAVADSSGTVALVGTAATAGSFIAPSRLPTAASGAGATNRMFDEIFGGSDASTRARPAAVANKGKSRGLVKTMGKGKEVASSVGTASLPDLAGVLLDSPAHTLPPVRMLWRELLTLPHAQPEGQGDHANAEVTFTSQPARQELVPAALFAQVPRDTMLGIFERRLGVAQGS
ncbi:hypothetical protein JCM11641_001375 [Rhodosporidiobolus odoratus]